MASEFMTPRGKKDGMQAATSAVNQAYVAPPKQDYKGGGKHASSKKHVDFKSGGAKQRR